MKKITFLIVFGLCFALSTTVYATSITWDGSGETGTDPLGQTWIFKNFIDTAFRSAWGMPGYLDGTIPFEGDFVRDFHIKFDIADLTVIVPGFEIDTSSTFENEEPTVGYVTWNKYIWDSDSDGKLDSIAFWAPPGGQLDSGEEFYVNVIFKTQYANGAEGIPTFTASWTEDGTPIPEPTTMLLLGTGLVGVAGATKRRKKNQTT